MTRLVISTIILFFFTFSFSQNGLKSLDSTEYNRIEGLLKEADAFYKVDLDSALFYIDKAILNLKPYQAYELKAKTRLYKSRYLLFKREYGSIIETLQSNIDNAALISLETLGRSYKDIGHVYKQEWIPDSALVNYIKALKAFERTGNKRSLSLTYLALGLVYSKMDKKELSQQFYDKSIAFSTNTKIMKIHKDEIVDKPLSYNKSLEISLDIAKIADERSDNRLLVITYSDIKKDYFRLKKYDKALEFAEKELEIRRRTKFNSSTPNTLSFIGDIYLLKNDYSKAIYSFKNAEVNATDSLKLHIYKSLKKAYIKNSKFNDAIEVMEQYENLKEIINNRNVEASITEITSQYQDEKQRQEIKTLNFQNEAKAEKISNQRLTLFSTIAGSLLLLLLAYFGYKNYKSKQDLNYTQLNFKLLQTQLNPHFMFNALNEIKLNLDSHNSEDSSEHLTAYSKLMRLILEGSNQEFVTIEEDAMLISKFLQLQQLVHSNNFEYEVTIDEALDTHYMLLPPMLTQPFVENAILHGVSQLKNGKVHVNYKEVGTALIIEIIDNGKGIKKTLDHSGKQLYQSLGTGIIDQRIKNYKKLYNYTIESMVMSDEKNGTTVTLTCPIQLKNTSWQSRA